MVAMYAVAAASSDGIAFMKPKTSTVSATDVSRVLLVAA